MYMQAVNLFKDKLKSEPALSKDHFEKVAARCATVLHASEKSDGDHYAQLLNVVAWAVAAGDTVDVKDYLNEEQLQRHLPNTEKDRKTWRSFTVTGKLLELATSSPSGSQGIMQHHSSSSVISSSLIPRLWLPQEAAW